MIVDKDAQLLKGPIDSLDALFESFEHAPETVVLDQKQQLLFRLAVMIESGEADAGRARDITHGRRVITLFGKDPRRRAKDQFEFLIVTRKIAIHKSRPQIK